MSKNINDPRRAFLVDALSIGLFTGANVAGIFQASRAMGDIPSKLPPGQSIFRLEGRVTVNGTIADINTKIGPNSLIRTGPDSLIIFVVETDAFGEARAIDFHRGESFAFPQQVFSMGRILGLFGGA